MTTRKEKRVARKIKKARAMMTTKKSLRRTRMLTWMTASTRMSLKLFRRKPQVLISAVQEEPEVVQDQQLFNRVPRKSLRSEISN